MAVACTKGIKIAVVANIKIVRTMRRKYGYMSCIVSLLYTIPDLVGMYPILDDHFTSYSSVASWTSWGAVVIVRIIPYSEEEP